MFKNKIILLPCFCKGVQWLVIDFIRWISGGMRFELLPEMFLAIELYVGTKYYFFI